MSVLESTLNWRVYLRNRLHRVMERAGWERFQRYGVIGEKKRRPIDLIIELDFVHTSFCHSIEKYGLKINDLKSHVSVLKSNELHPDLSPGKFSLMMYQNYQTRTEFIQELSEEDLKQVFETSLFESSVSIQWLLEFSNYYEQSLTEKTIHLVRQQDPGFYVPWSTEQYMRPVKPPKL